MMKYCELILSRIVTFFGIIGGLAVFLMMVIMCVDVGGRYFLNNPLPGSVEFTEVLVVVSVFVALAAVQARKAHIRFTLIESLPPFRGQRLIPLLGLVLAICVMALITWQTGKQTYISISSREYRWGTILFPIWPGKLAVCLGSGLFCLQLLFDLIFGVISLFQESLSRATGNLEKAQPKSNGHAF